MTKKRARTIWTRIKKEEISRDLQTNGRRQRRKGEFQTIDLKILTLECLLLLQRGIFCEGGGDVERAVRLSNI